MYQIVPSNGNVAAKYELWMHTQWPKLSVGPSKIQGLNQRAAGSNLWMVRPSLMSEAMLPKKSHTMHGANFGLIAIFSGVEALYHCTSACFNARTDVWQNKTFFSLSYCNQCYDFYHVGWKNLRKGNGTSWWGSPRRSGSFSHTFYACILTYVSCRILL